MMRDNEYINVSKPGEAHKTNTLNVTWLLVLKS